MFQTIAKSALALTLPGLLFAAAPAAASTSFAVPVVSSAPAEAATWNHGRRDRGYDDYDGSYGYGDYRGYDDGYDRRRYDEPVYRDTRVWHGEDGRYDCRHRDGTTGLLIGGVAGALLGREVAGRRGDRTLGMILGAAGGALLGREIDRGGSRCR